MQLNKNQALIVLGGFGLLVLVSVLIFTNLRSSSQAQPVTLNVWGIDRKDVWEAIADSYHNYRPNVEVRYRQIPENLYEETVRDALAAGEGPDVLMISNRALRKDKGKLTPAPAATVSLIDLRDAFPTAVEQDFVSSADIYALPLYLDTLALLYNKTMFDQAAVVNPPKTWADLQTLVPTFRRVTGANQVTSAAVALGGSERSVAGAVDILNLLMLQNGTAMLSSDGTASFNSPEGVAALSFYTQFANPLSPLYTWSDSQPASAETFAAGKTAMIVDYKSGLDAIVKKSPFLSLGIAPVPQPVGASVSISFPNYQGLAVSRQSQNSSFAWDFVRYATLTPEVASTYAATTGHPVALRSLIAAKVNDPNLGVFARQALTARSWQQPDPAAVGTIFNQAIVGVLSGQFDASRALSQAQDQMNQIVRTRGQ